MSENDPQIHSLSDALTAQPDGASRRALLKGAGITTAAAALLAACGGGSSASGGNVANGAAKSGAGNFPTTPKYKFVFVNHVTTNPFFQATQYGIQDACALLNVGYQWTGSENSIVSQMVTAMNTAISGKADGIAVALIDKSAFNAPTKAALKAGIPVVSYNADVPPPANERLAYIGQDLFVSGQQMGERIAQTLPANSKIAIFIATPGALNIQPRADGATQALKAANKGYQVKQVATGADLNPEQSTIDAFSQGNKDYKGLYAVDAGSTQGIANVMKKYNLKSQGVHGGGFDLLVPTENSIKAGILDFTIDQSPYMQGFLPVVYLYLYKLSGTLVSPPTTDTGLKFITKALVGPYLTSTNRFEGSSAKQQLITQ
jgi:simple sugar transport system substrate-binding protein